MSEVIYNTPFVDGEVLTAEALSELYRDIKGAVVAIDTLENTVGIGIDQIPETDNLLSRVNTLENSLKETDPEAAEGSEATFADRVSDLEEIVGINTNGKTLSQRVDSLEASDDDFETRVSTLEGQVLATEAGDSTESLVNRVTTLESKEVVNSEKISSYSTLSEKNYENIKKINKAICGSTTTVYYDNNKGTLDARVTKLENIRVKVAEYNTSNSEGADILWSETIPDSLTLKSGQLFFKVK